MAGTSRYFLRFLSSETRPANELNDEDYDPSQSLQKKAKSQGADRPISGNFLVLQKWIKSSATKMIHTRYRFCDLVSNHIAGEIEFDSSVGTVLDMSLIRNRGILMTTHQNMRGGSSYLTVWNISSGLGERIEFFKEDRVYWKIAVENSGEKLVNGPNVIDIESRKKIGSLVDWNSSDGIQNCGFTFDDRYFVGYAQEGLRIWEMEKFTLIPHRTPEPSQWVTNVEMGTYSSLCIQQTDNAAFVWDVAEQALKLSVKEVDPENDHCRFGAHDNTLVILKVSVTQLRSASIWDIATASLLRFVDLNVPTTGISARVSYLFYKFNPMNGKLITGFHCDKYCEGPLTMVELDLETKEFTYTTTTFCGEVTRQVGS